MSFHLSVRFRDARREYDGSDEVDLGPTQIGRPRTRPSRNSMFGPLSRNRVDQTTIGLAYDGRWKDVGEISFGVSRANYRKTTTSRASRRSSHARPLGSTTAPLRSTCRRRFALRRLCPRAGGKRRRPPNAANRNQPLDAVLTEQKDAGLRWNVTGNVKVIAGVFDLPGPISGSMPRRTTARSARRAAAAPNSRYRAI